MLSEEITEKEDPNSTGWSPTQRVQKGKSRHWKRTFIYFQFLFYIRDPLEEEMATHSCILA